VSPRTGIEERRETVLRASIPVFAQYGFDAATTAEIAERSGVTQPYLLKLFGSKKRLFIEACDHNMRTLMAQMRDSAGGKTGREALEAMGAAAIW
jgi:AcrR family transcriptional regulator